MYYCDYLTRTTFRFYLIDFQFKTDFPPQFCVVYRKITQHYLKIGFSRKCLKKQTNKQTKNKKKKPIAFTRKTIAASNSFNRKQFQVFKIAKFEFKVAYGQNILSCDP